MRSIPNHSHWNRQAPFFFRKERHGLSWLFPKREVDHDLLVAIRMLFTPKLQQEGRHLSLSPVMSGFDQVRVGASLGRVNLAKTPFWGICAELD
jgi:hypothetical protein